MTYPPQQPSFPPPQDPYVSSPPTQPFTDSHGQSDPFGRPVSAPAYPGYQHPGTPPHGFPPPGFPPAGFQQPPRRPIWPWLLAVAALSLILVSAGGWVLYDRVLREDSGVAACKSLAAEDKSGTGGTADDKFTKDEYLQMRKVFADSRYPDLRDHGTKLMDILWQVSQLGADNEQVAMTYLQPLTEHISGLQSACADHGVILDLKLTD